jgi:hypothetical protein
MKVTEVAATTGTIATVTYRTTRFWVYISCTVLAVLISCVLGKDMMWDNLHYHFYAGFSALHDRFGRDYFAAGAQSYLNPYIYAPFYALASTGLPALWIASVLAAVQSAILWLTYEMAVAVSPPGNAQTRIAAGACAALLALANPILIGQLGSSYADITTAEIVLGGWLLLVYALRAPSARRIVCAGLLLGAASALKLTNSLHALSACVLLLFLPTTWRRKTRLSLGFIAALAVSFAVVAGPWAMRLELHFGSPFFPLFNNIFRSPQFPAVPLADYRFVPSSLAEALWRPVAVALPVTFVDDERASPDLRYALLLMLALLVLLRWAWRRLRRAPDASVVCEEARAGDGLVALSCAFLVDWVLWLRLSANGRYFLAMACVAGVLGVGLACRIFAARRDVLALLLTAVFVVQGVQLAFGTEYRAPVGWDGGSWFEVSVPAALRNSPDLYFLLGQQSDSFIAPFLARGSAFVNLDGGYVLGPDGANGARIQALIREHAGHIRVGVMAGEFVLSPPKGLPDAAHVNDTLAFFGLRADVTDCSSITVRNMRYPWREVLPGANSMNLQQIKANLLRVPQSRDGYLVTCRVVQDPGSRLALANAEREPDLVFDRMEDECPLLFQPPRPVTEAYGDSQHGYIWMRIYPGSNLTALISEGSLRVVDGARGGRADVLGSESDWAKGSVQLACGRHGELYYAKAVSSARSNPPAGCARRQTPARLPVCRR